MFSMLLVGMKGGGSLFDNALLCLAQPSESTTPVLEVVNLRPAQFPKWLPGGSRICLVYFLPSVVQRIALATGTITPDMPTTQV